MKKAIFNFESILLKLYGENMVLGGSQALKQHGLNFSRESNDLDVILYNPTSIQIAVLEIMKPFQVKRDNLPHFTQNQENDYICSLANQISSGLKFQHSYKFKKNDMILDILIEQKETPKDLLLLEFNSYLSNKTMYFKVQSIKNTIDAKRSYIAKSQADRFGGTEYARKKDFLDFLDLKNSNFNI